MLKSTGFVEFSCAHLCQLADIDFSNNDHQDQTKFIDSLKIFHALLSFFITTLGSGGEKFSTESATFLLSWESFFVEVDFSCFTIVHIHMNMKIVFCIKTVKRGFEKSVVDFESLKLIGLFLKSLANYRSIIGVKFSRVVDVMMVKYFL